MGYWDGIRTSLLRRIKRAFGLSRKPTDKGQGRGKPTA